MNKLLEGLDQFHRCIYREYEHTFRGLAAEQHPLALLITCSDSRIDPSLLLQCDPGDVFVCRNAGNLIPPYHSDASGMAASVEYAIDVLGIRDVIVCGHSDCGAMKAVLKPESVADRPAIARWLGNADPARRIVRARWTEMSDSDRVRLAAQENVIAQLCNLATYPCVAAALAEKRMNLYGWYYDIGEGRVDCFDPQLRQFIPFDGTLPTGASQAA